MDQLLASSPIFRELDVIGLTLGLIFLMLVALVVISWQNLKALESMDQSLKELPAVKESRRKAA